MAIPTYPMHNDLSETRLKCPLPIHSSQFIRIIVWMRLSGLQIDSVLCKVNLNWDSDHDELYTCADVH